MAHVYKFWYRHAQATQIHVLTLDVLGCVIGIFRIELSKVEVLKSFLSERQLGMQEDYIQFV